MKNILIMFWQFATYFIIGIPLRIIFNVKTTKLYKIEKGKVYILIANHIRMFDSFLIVYSMPMKDGIKLFPFRFIIDESYVKKPHFAFILLLLYGCISTEKINGKSAIDRAKESLKNNETVVIFPSGRLRNEDKIRVGMVYLEREVKNSMLLPIKITYKQDKTEIEYKETFRHNDFPEDLQPLANKTYQLIKK